MERKLTGADAKVGSFVAIRRLESDPWTPAGYGTQFYLGRVEDLTVEPGGDDIKSLRCCHLIPFANGKPCNDESKSWKRACWGMHEHVALCERRTKCIKARPEGASTSAMQFDCDPASVFETYVELTSKESHLTADSKKRIAESAPEPGSWNNRLGYHPEKKRKQRAKKK